jgi:hypothetical protein
VKITSRSGASSAKTVENQAYFSTGSFKNGIRSVKFSTLESDETKATGIVQKIHRTTVNTKLISSPICLILLLFPTFFQLSNSFITSWIGKAGMLDDNRREERRVNILYEISLHKIWHRWLRRNKRPRLGVMNSLASNIRRGKVGKGNECCIAGRSFLPADLEFLEQG